MYWNLAARMQVIEGIKQSPGVHQSRKQCQCKVWVCYMRPCWWRAVLITTWLQPVIHLVERVHINEDFVPLFPWLQRGLTALMYAVLGHHLSVVKELMTAQAELKTRDKVCHHLPLSITITCNYSYGMENTFIGRIDTYCNFIAWSEICWSNELDTTNTWM